MHVKQQESWNLRPRALKIFSIANIVATHNIFTNISFQRKSQDWKETRNYIRSQPGSRKSNKEKDGIFEASTGGYKMIFSGAQAIPPIIRDLYQTDGFI